MKKLLIIFATVLLFCAAAFSQESLARKSAGGENSSEIEFPILCLKLAPYCANFAKYQKMNAMFRAAALNEKIKNQKLQHGLAQTFFETLIGGIVTDAICAYADDFPQKNDATETAALLMGATAYFGILASNEIEKAKYLQNANNYNLSLISSAGK